MWSKLISLISPLKIAYAWCKKNIYAVLGGAFTLLLLLLGIERKVIKNQKETIKEKEAEVLVLEKTKAEQIAVVESANEQSAAFTEQKDTIIAELVPEITKAKDIPKEEQKPLSDPVKAMAKAQVERIKARNKK